MKNTHPNITSTGATPHRIRRMIATTLVAASAAAGTVGVSTADAADDPLNVAETWTKRSFPNGPVEPFGPVTPFVPVEPAPVDPRTPINLQPVPWVPIDPVPGDEPCCFFPPGDEPPPPDEPPPLEINPCLILAVGPFSPMRPTIVIPPGETFGFGTPGNDIIIGNDGNNIIYGNGGNDLICAGDGTDTVFGGDGDDTIHGQGGIDTLHGDSLHGTPSFGPDGKVRSSRTTPGPAGAFNIGNDTIYGGLGSDTVRGNEGNDTLHAQTFRNASETTSRDSLIGGDGNDTIVGHAGVDYADGQNGDDTIDLGPGNDLAFGGRGEDTIAGGTGADDLHGDDDLDYDVIYTGDRLNGLQIVQSDGAVDHYWLDQVVNGNQFRDRVVATREDVSH